MKNKFFMTLAGLMLLSTASFAQIKSIGGYDHPRPAVVTPPTETNGTYSAPSDAIVLFDGTNLSEWQAGDGTAPKWAINNGILSTQPKCGDLKTKREFRDFQLHIEFMHPADITGETQMRGNSGVYLQNLYEIQVLETYNNNNKTYVNGQCGAIYTQHAPLVNPLRKPGEWNAYDIVFTAPTFNKDGSYKTNPRVTVLLNGVLIHNNAMIYGFTNNNTVVQKEIGGITLQDHGCPVNYRNIWIREL